MFFLLLPRLQHLIHYIVSRDDIMALWTTLNCRRRKQLYDLRFFKKHYIGRNENKNQIHFQIQAEIFSSFLTGF